MKVGDLVRYIGVGGGDNVTGVVVSVAPGDSPPWAEVVWSMPSGAHYDEVPLEDLELVNESR